MEQTVFFITGVSGSGKTSIGSRLAAYLGIPFLDGDDFHPPENKAKMKAGIPLQDADREGWLAALNVAARAADSVVVACSALKERYREQLSRDIQESRVRWIHLSGDFDLIRRRMEARTDHFMPPALLSSQMEAYEPPPSGLHINVAQTPEEILQYIITEMELPTQFGIVGLGVMGLSLARNCARNHIALSLYNRFEAGKEEKVAEKAVLDFPELRNARPFESLPDFVQSLSRPRKILLMVNAGAPVDAVLDQLMPLLSAGDLLLDAGNSHYKDTERRQQACAERNLHFLGVGVSGGESGALNGPSIMAGGVPQAYAMAAPFLEKIAARDAGNGVCANWIGPGGAGHFVKMVHNGIEYAEMQLLAEVYSVLRWELGHSPDQVADILETWQAQNLKSYLLEITIAILRRREGTGWLLDKISDQGEHKGTGSWASMAASELGVPLTLMTEALFARFVAAMRSYRQELAAVYLQDAPAIQLDIQDLQHAYQLARILNHHQGFQLIRAGSEQNQWQINLPELARIWTNGCIIRSELMQDAQEYLSENGDMLQYALVRDWIIQHKSALQRSVSSLGMSHRAYPCLMAALAALNAQTTAVSAAHLIQAQRDYFGAHLYERTDDPSGKKYHTNWA